MKKMLPFATALALLITGCAQQTFTVQKQTISSNWVKSSPIISSFLNWAEETVDAAKICGGAEMLLKQKNPANIRVGLFGFIT